MGKRHRPRGARGPVLAAVVVALLGLVAAYFVNLVTEQAPPTFRRWAWPVLGCTVVLLLVLTAVQARRGAAAAKSSERKVAERRQAARRVEAEVRRALDETFAVVPRLPVRTKDRPDLVRPANPLPDAPRAPDRLREHHEDIEEIFDRSGGSLLLLGAGGTGKSTLLAELCLWLCRRARDDERPSVPVLVNLTSWGEGDQSLEQWLAQAVVDTYPGLDRDLVLEWIENRALLPLLDGLDETATGRGRVRALAELGAFLAAGPCPIAVACRTDDLPDEGVPPGLSCAVEIRKPTRDQVTRFLAGLDSPAADAVRAVSPLDRSWWSMVSTPVVLGIVARVSSIAPEAGLVTEGSARHRRRHIISVYVDALLRRRAGRGPEYPPPDARRWLAWLATWMGRHGRTDFYVDRLPASWIKDVTDVRVLKARYHLWLGAMWVAAVGVTVLITALGGQVDGIAVTVYGTITTVATSLHISRHNQSATEPIEPVWTMRGHWVPGLLFMVVCTAFAVLFAAPDGRTATEVAAWALTGLVVSVPGGLAIVMAPTSMPNRAGLPAGERIRRSRRMAWQGAVLVGLPVAVLSGGLRAFTFPEPGFAIGTAAVFAVFSTTCCWLIFGGVPALQYRAFFGELRRAGCGPSDYLRFLDWATERLLLHRAGSALRFSHKEIQRYLAESWPPSRDPRSPVDRRHRRKPSRPPR